MYSAFMTELCDFMVDAGIATADACRGCSEVEIEQLERRLSLPLPAAMLECLRRLGHACGHLMDGDKFGLSAFEEAREVAQEITAKPHSPWRLPDRVIPFVQHHGYEFLFVHGSAGDDPPVWLYVETEPTAREVRPSFTAWLRESALEAVEIEPWHDEVCREMRLHRDDWMARKKTLDEYNEEANQIRQSLMNLLMQSDRERGKITGPTEFQQIWNREFPNTDLFRKLTAQQKRVPWCWINPKDA
jgi:hypothetical protein